MYRIKSKRCLFLGLLFSGSLLLGQKIIHMNGSYDLDGDKRLEFISLELDPDTDVFPTAPVVLQPIEKSLPPLAVPSNTEKKKDTE